MDVSSDQFYKKIHFFANVAQFQDISGFFLEVVLLHSNKSFFGALKKKLLFIDSIRFSVIFSTLFCQDQFMFSANEIL